MGRFPGEGKGYPLQYSGLENSINCIVHVVAKSRTRLSDFQSVNRDNKQMHFKIPYELGIITLVKIEWSGSFFNLKDKMKCA